jgi:hypothetical protein
MNQEVKKKSQLKVTWRSLCQTQNLRLHVTRSQTVWWTFIRVSFIKSLTVKLVLRFQRLCSLKIFLKKKFSLSILTLVHSTFLDMTFYGLLMLGQKGCSQFGDGQGALAMWKNSMADYHDTNKVLIGVIICVFFKLYYSSLSTEYCVTVKLLLVLEFLVQKSRQTWLTTAT